MRYSIKALIQLSRRLVEKNMDAIPCQFYFAVNPRDAHIILKENHQTFLHALLNILHWCQRTFEGYVVISTEISSPYVIVSIKQDKLQPYVHPLAMHPLDITDPLSAHKAPHTSGLRRHQWRNTVTPSRAQENGDGIHPNKTPQTLSLLGGISGRPFKMVPTIRTKNRQQTAISHLIATYPLQHAAQLLETMDGLISYTSSTVRMRLPIEQFRKIILNKSTIYDEGSKLLPTEEDALEEDGFTWHTPTPISYDQVQCHRSVRVTDDETLPVRKIPSHNEQLNDAVFNHNKAPKTGTLSSDLSKNGSLANSHLQHTLLGVVKKNGTPFQGRVKNDGTMKGIKDETMKGVNGEIIKGLNDEIMHGLKAEIMKGLNDETLKEVNDETVTRGLLNDDLLTEEVLREGLFRDDATTVPLYPLH